jgi:protein tyrosine phosphatase (PTP) superfamily phosphohydrolase (DUF442 family)
MTVVMKTTIAAVLGLVLAACAGAPAPQAGSLMDRGEAAGIHNLAEIAPGLFRGAQPEGEDSFALLASLGVRTLLSVDGSRPDVDGAARHGLRYVHVPVGYSGITRPEQLRIARAALDLPGPMFVHCHHGKHRGPAASGIAWMVRCGVSPEEVVADMRKAGTDPKYAGLYGDVVAFRPVTAEELATVTEEDIGPVAKLPDLVEAMVQVDASFDRMKAVKKAGWRTPASMPDVQPAHEARILAERFRELGRMEEAMRKPADFQGWREASEKAAWALEEALGKGDGAAAGAALDRVGTTCNACHDVYRNARKP